MNPGPAAGVTVDGMTSFSTIRQTLAAILLLLTTSAGARQSVGLVLSGGGTKGIAHIGFIQAMEENSIPIDYITGTSMGAIVGALYASGYSPAEMMQLLTSPEFMDYTMGHTSDADRYGFNTPPPSAQWISVNVASTGRLRQMMPHAIYDSVTGMYTLDLHADVAKPMQLGIGGYLTSGNRSMLYVRAARNNLSYLIPDWQMEGWAGQSYLAARGQISSTLPTRLPQRLILSLGASRDIMFESEKMFYDFNSPAFVTNSEVSAMLHWQMAAGRHGILELNTGYGHLTARFRDPLPDGAVKPARRIIRNLAKIGTRWTHTTLDDASLPTRGSEFRIGVLGTMGRRHVKLDDHRVTSSPRWMVAEVSGSRYFAIADNFSLGVNAEMAWSTQKLTTTYAASLIESRSYTPFWSMENEFDAGLRANQYIAAGITPVLKLGSMFQIRLSGQMFAPMRRILPGSGNTARYSGWFGSCEFAGELTAALKLPFGCVRGYVDYRTTSFCHWSAGISIGMLLKAPRFLRP